MYQIENTMNIEIDQEKKDSKAYNKSISLMLNVLRGLMNDTSKLGEIELIKLYAKYRNVDISKYTDKTLKQWVIALSRGVKQAVRDDRRSRPKQPKIKKPKKKVSIADKMYIHMAGNDSKPSVAEKIIIKFFKTNNVKFFREVSFRGFGIAAMPYRFDFYLPQFNLIIEYDGAHHLKEKVHERDVLKNNFCKTNHIKLVRLNKDHYHNLSYHLDKLLKSFNK